MKSSFRHPPAFEKLVVGPERGGVLEHARVIASDGEGTAFVDVVDERLVLTAARIGCAYSSMRGVSQVCLEASHSRSVDSE
jgi:hypothetical protein